MPLTISGLTVPAYVRSLHVLTRYLDKALAAVADGHSTDEALVQARLAPDMLPLSGQIQRASDTSKLAIARLLGVDAPPFADDETTLTQLKERIAKTLAWIESADTAALDAAATRQITLTFGPHKKTVSGEDMVTAFALPNFYFHVATAHAILRNAGIAVGKVDYLGVTG